MPLLGLGGTAITIYRCRGTDLQRLFSTFANGWPGVGLLILRVVLGSFLVQDAFTAHTQREPALNLQTLVLRDLAALGALFLLVGMWTPVIAALLALLEIWLAAKMGQFWPFFLSAASAIALALIGPGSHSLDARKFGRKRLIIEERAK